jgi:hypothetical protein
MKLLDLSGLLPGPGVSVAGVDVVESVEVEIALKKMDVPVAV